MISWDWEEMKWKGITMQDIEVWERLYPDVDIAYQLKIKMVEWFVKWKGTKKVQKKRWDRFICNWLSKAQVKAVLG